MASGHYNGMKAMCPSRDCDQREMCPQAVQVALATDHIGPLRSDDGAAQVVSVTVAQVLQMDVSVKADSS